MAEINLHLETLSCLTTIIDPPEVPAMVAPSEHVVVSPAVVAAPAKVVVLALVLTLVAARRRGPVWEEGSVAR